MTVSISPMTTIKNRCHQIDYRALAETGEISDDLYYFRLCCLLENAAKCANTASVYGAFFKHLKQSAQKTLVIAPADYQINNGEHEVYNEDANSLIKRIEGDILYLDPPYNSRQYSANYHLLNTIADYKSFTPKGKTELREYNKSNYCSKAKVQHTFKDLIRNARFRYIVLSYNNEGIMPMQTIEQIMTKYGNYQMFQKPVTVKKAQTDTGTEGVTDGSVNIGLRYHPFFQRLPGRCHNHFLIIGKAVHSCLQSISHCFRVGPEIFMVIYGLLHIPAVADHMAGACPRSVL